jgi:hypothetical protein
LATDRPSPTPVPGATDADVLPYCDPSVQPQPAPPEPADPAVAGPVDLRVVGRLGGTARAAWLDGDRLLVGAGSQVALVDLTDPRDPREVAVSASLAGSVEAVEPLGDGFAVAAGDGGLVLLDAQLAVQSSVPLPGHSHAVAVDGATAYVADGTGGLRVVDLTDPASPRPLASFLDLHRIRRCRCRRGSCVPRRR